MSDGETVISWPDEHTPERSVFHAVNELQMQAEPDVVWAWLCRPDLWSRYYSNAKFIKHLGGAWPKLELGSRFRWFSFGAFVRRYPELRGTVTDLLIGDLFTDRVDKVWAPMESMYPSDKKPIPPWNAGSSPEAAPDKANELTLPEGRTR